MNKIQIGVVAVWCFIILMSVCAINSTLGLYETAYKLSEDETAIEFNPTYQGWFIEEKGYYGYEIIGIPIFLNTLFLFGIYIMLEEKHGYFHRHLRLNVN